MDCGENIIAQPIKQWQHDSDGGFSVESRVFFCGTNVVHKLRRTGQTICIGVNISGRISLAWAK